MNREVLECLIRAGACDSLGENRATLFAQVERVMARAQSNAADRARGQASLFGGGDAAAPSDLKLPRVDDWAIHERLVHDDTGQLLTATFLDYKLPGAEDEFVFDMWQTWADPLAHANHPAYIDWCDEASSRHMLAAGLDPVLLRPVAEQVSFRSAVLPGERVTVLTKRIGVIGTDAVVLKHHLETERSGVRDPR